VLIPVFALGRAQELCILLETYWERMNLNVPIYFSAGLTEKATNYYRLFINWTNQKIKKTFVNRNMFEFKHISSFERGMADDPGPMVLFATPGMLHAGTSLEVFKKWAGNEKNLTIIPGYCVVGTVGNKLTAGRKGPFKVELDKNTVLDVRCKIKYLSFSAHADAKGILQLINQAQPSNVVLVHGEKSKMQSLKQRIMRELNIPCFDPPNGTTVTIQTIHPLPLHLSRPLLKRHISQIYAASSPSSLPLPSAHSPASVSTSIAMSTSASIGGPPVLAGSDSWGGGPSTSTSSSSPSETRDIRQPKRIRCPIDKTPINGILVMDQQDPQNIQLLEPEEAIEQLGLPYHTLKFSSMLPIPKATLADPLLDLVYADLAQWTEPELSRDARCVRLRSLRISIQSGTHLFCTWSYEDEDLASHALAMIGQLLEEVEVQANAHEHAE
jgi:hypothetical protein